jgi:hypothetical protein
LRAAQCQHLCDAAAHVTRTDNRDFLDGHDKLQTDK